MKLQRNISLLLMLLLTNVVYSQRTKIISFGWDYPDTEKLIKNAASMQDKPFDGVCFSLQADPIEAFDTDVKNSAYFNYDKLSTVQWGRFTDNYIFMRGMSREGGSWLDDEAWEMIKKNMAGVSRILKLKNVAGVLFDPEYYYEDQLKNPWTYSKEQYPRHSFGQMQDIVRKRGREFIEALQQEDNSFNLLSIWLASLAAAETTNMPLEKSRHALLISFMEGVLTAKHKNVTLIDGNETAYWFSTPSQFLESTDKLRKRTCELMKTKKAKKLIPLIKVSQPVFYDGIMATNKGYERGFKNISKWNWLEENVKLTMVSSNSNLVWFYDENKNWWKTDMNDTLYYILTNPVQRMLANVKITGRNKINSLTGKKLNNINSGIGSKYIIKPGLPIEQEDVSFEYTWDKSTKMLSLNYLLELPVNVAIYKNGEKIATPTIAKNTNFKLEKFNSGEIAILAKYTNGYEAYAIVTY